MGTKPLPSVRACHFERSREISTGYASDTRYTTPRSVRSPASTLRKIKANELEAVPQHKLRLARVSLRFARSAGIFTLASRKTVAFARKRRRRRKRRTRQVTPALLQKATCGDDKRGPLGGASPEPTKFLTLINTNTGGRHKCRPPVLAQRRECRRNP